MAGTAPSKALLERARKGEIGGVVLFGFNVRDEAQLAAATRTLQEAAKAGGQPPLLIAVDQEGGGIRRLPWAQPVASASRMGRMEPDEVRSIGAASGPGARGRRGERRPRAGRGRAGRQPVVHARRAPHVLGRSRGRVERW